MLCFVVVMQSFIMNLHEVFIHIHQGCFAGTGAIVRLPQCRWSKPDGYGKISQCITTTKHSKAKTVCIFLGIYCRWKKILYNPAFRCSNNSMPKNNTLTISWWSFNPTIQNKTDNRHAVIFVTENEFGTVQKILAIFFKPLCLGFTTACAFVTI